jgi:hypothetical protein
MHMAPPSREPISTLRCRRCRPLLFPLTRTRAVVSEGRTASYVAHYWVCSRCGREWEDEALRRQNGVAAELALLAASRRLAR